MSKKQARLDDEIKIVVVKRENPFEQGTDRAKRAGAVLSSNGKTYADAKKKGADSWAVRQLVKRGAVRLRAA
jgi:hypothetical protein